MNNRDDLDQMMLLEDKIARLEIIVHENIDIMHKINNSSGIKWFWNVIITHKFDRANNKANEALQEMWKLRDQLWELQINS